MTRILALALYCAALVPAQSLEFWHLTDTHLVAPGTPGAKDQHRPNGETLRRFLSTPRTADFYLITGDLVDAYQYRMEDGQVVRGQAEAFQLAIQSSPVPVFVCVGNHDIQAYTFREGRLEKDESVAGSARAGWARTLPAFADGTWYRIERKAGKARYALYVLDNAYAAGPAPDQLLWLRTRLAAESAQHVIVALHIPLQAEDNFAEIRKALGASPRVRMILAGHRHSDGIEELNLGSLVVPQVRTAIFGEGSARRIVLSEDSIAIYSTGDSKRMERSIALTRP